MFMSHEILMDTYTVQALHKASKTGPVLEVVSLIFMDDNFLTRVVKEPTRKGVLVDVVPTKEDWLGM